MTIPRSSTLALVALSLVLLLTSTPAAAVSCFYEKNGNVVIQTENTKLTAGWQCMTNFKGFSGRCYLKWMRDNQYEYKKQGILVYHVYASGGTYRVNAYTGRSSGDPCRHDECNDIYVKRGGEMVKLFTGYGHQNNIWKMSDKFDHNHQKTEPMINLKKGRNVFVIAARSENVMLDRIVLTKAGSQMTMNPGSTMRACPGGGGGKPKPKPKPKKKRGPKWNYGRQCGHTLRSGKRHGKAKLKVTNRKSFGIKVILINSKGKMGRRVFIRKGRSKMIKTFKGAFYRIAFWNGGCVRGFRVTKGYRKLNVGGHKRK